MPFFNARRVYMGMTTYRNNASGEKEVFDGQHEALISLDVWEKCQQVRATRCSASRSVQKNFRHYQCLTTCL